MHIMAWLFTSFLIFFTTASRADAYENPVILRAVRGQEARLPCGQAKLFLDGPKSYVLWLRNSKNIVYRYPNEMVDTRSHFGTSCDSGLCPEYTSLLIKKVSTGDAGFYTCRIHYQASPSVDFKIELKIVEPTGSPKIYSGTGELLDKGFVGPLGLHTNLTLFCEVEDDDTQTEVYWRRNGEVVNHQSSSRIGCVLRVEIQLLDLSRDELDARYECRAQNSDVSEPLVASVEIKMFMPPLSVEIRMNNNSDFEAGQPRVVDCVVVGCIPPPEISWYLGSTMVRSSVHKELHDGNYTVSSLTLAPSLRDHRTELVCRAHNPMMPAGKFEDKVTVNVGYRPTCGLSRYARIGAVKGESEAVLCFVESSPEPLQFSWTFADSSTIYTSSTKMKGYHTRYHSLLNWVARGDEIGILSCRATNKFGEMKKPCIFNISAGGPPAQPDCEITRFYPNSLKVLCDKGWNGGRPQMVHLELIDEEGVRIKNMTDQMGRFFVENYEYKKNVTAVLYSKNSRGKSKDRVLHLQSVLPISEADNNNNNVKLSWLLFFEVFACGVSLFIFLTAFVLAMKILLSRPQTADANPDIGSQSDGIFHREPDVIRDERVLGLPPSTCITVNTLTGCQNQYSSSPKPACRVLVAHGAHSSPEHSYYV